MRQSSCVLLILALQLSAGGLFAENGMWTGTDSDAWTNDANWSVSPYPSGTNTATFSGAGNGNTTVSLDGLACIKTIAFDTVSVAPYTFGSGGANAQTLVLTNNSLIQSSSLAWNDQTFNAAVQLGADRTTAFHAFRVDNSLRKLVFNGKVSGAPSGGTSGTKTLASLGTGNIVFNDNVAKGGVTTLVVTNALTDGRLTFNGASNALNTLYLTGATNNTVEVGGGLYLSNVGSVTLYSSQGGTITGAGKIWMSTSDGPSATGYNYADCYVASGKTLVINPEITGPGGFEMWSGAGTFVLNGNNTFEAHVVIGSSGTISVSKIGNRGSTTSNLGKGSKFRFNGVNARLLYTGGGETTDRALVFNTNAIIEQAGTGNLIFSAPPTFAPNGAVTVTLQGSTTGTGELSGVVSNCVAAPASLIKAGSGTWTLSGANRLAGKLTVSGGTLRLAGVSGSLAYCTNFTVNANATLLLENSASANNGDRVNNAAPIILNNATLSFSHDGSSADYSETAGELIVSAGLCTVTCSQAAEGKTSSVTFSGLTQSNSALLNFTGIGLGESDRSRIFIAGQPEGIIGLWATINGTELAAYDSVLGVIPASLSGDYRDIAARGYSVITNNPGATVRINTDGVSGPIVLSDTTTAIGTLMQYTLTPATVDVSNKTFRADNFVIPQGRAALTVGTAASEGALTPATPGASLFLVNQTTSPLTLNASVADNGAASGLTTYDAGPVVLAGSNTYSGPTSTGGGALLIANSYALQNSTLTSAATFDDSVIPREFLLGGLSGSFGLVLEDDAGTPNPVSLTVGNNGSSTTLGGVLSGGGSLAKVGGGTLTLSGANTYSGGTVVSNGALTAGSAGALGTGPVVNDATLNLSAGNATYSGLAVALSGAGTVNVTLGSGSGSTYLTGDCSAFTGVWNVGMNGSGGKLQLNGADNPAAVLNALSNGTVWCNSSASPHTATIHLYGGNTGEANGQLRLDSGAEWAGPVFIAGDITDVNDGHVGSGTGTGVISGVIADLNGARIMTKTGSGRVYLTTPTNAYEGQTWIRYGALGATALKNVNEASSFGHPKNVTDGTIKLGNAGNGGRIVYLGTGDTTDRGIDLAGTTGGGIIEHAGTGLLKLSGDLSVSAAGNKPLTLDGSSDGAGEFAGMIANGAGSTIGVTKTGTGTWTLTSTNNSYTGVTSLSGGKLIAPNQKALGAGSIAFPASAILELNYNSDGEYPYPVGASAGAVATLLLGGDSEENVRHTLGGFAISTVTLNVSGVEGIPGRPSLTTPSLNLSSGGSGTTTLVPLDAELHIGTVAILSNTNLSKTIKLDGTNLYNTVTGCMSNGPGPTTVLSVLKDNVSQWSLFGSNSYSGATTVNNGSLVHYGLHAGSGATTVNGGLFANYGQFTGGGATTVNSNGVYLLAGAHSGAGAFAIKGGMLEIGGTNGTVTAASGVTLSANGVLAISNSAGSNMTDRLGDAIPVALTGGSIRFSHTAGGADYSEALGDLTVNSSSNTVAASQAAEARTSALTFASLAYAGGTLDFVGEGLGTSAQNQIIFATPPALSGGIIAPWATVNGTNFATYGAFGVTAYAGGGVTNLAARSGVPNSVIPDDAGVHARIVDDGDSGAITLAGAVTNSASTLTQANTNIAAEVAVSGKTLLASGVLIASDGASLTLGSAADDGVLAALTPGGTLSLINPSASALTVNASIADNGGSGLSRSGTGQTVLNGACSYTGPTALNDGSLVFASAAPQILTGAISGNGTLVKNGTNVLHLTATNTYTGPTFINEGIVRANQNATFGPTTGGGVVIADGATLDVGSTPDVGGTRGQNGLDFGTKLFTVQGNGVGGNGAIVNSATGGQQNAFEKIVLAGDTRFGGVSRWDIRGGTFTMNDFTLTKVGSGSFMLVDNAVSPGTGNIDIVSGIFRMEAGTKLNGSTNNVLRIRSGAELELYQLANIMGWSLIFEDGATFDAGNNSTSSATNRWSGPIAVNGALTLTGSNSTGGYVYRAVILGPISGTGPITETGTANITFAGTNTYTGQTRLNGGYLTVDRIGNVGEPGPLGQQATASDAAIKLSGGALVYTGPGETPERAVEFYSTGGGMLIHNGTGPLIFTNSLAVTANGSRTLTLRGTSDSAEFAGSLINGAGSTNSLVKSDTGTWLLSGNNSFSGSMTLNMGTLEVSGTNTQGSGSIYIANASNSNAVMRVQPGAQITGSGQLRIGSASGSAGALYMRGGVLSRTPTTGDENFGLGTINQNSYGYFSMSGGAVTNARMNLGGTDGRFGTGVARISGGTLKFSEYILLARTNGCAGILTMDGGTISRTGASQNISLAHRGGRGELNLTGGVIDNTGRNVTIRMGGQLAAHVATGMVNLCAGTLVANMITNYGATAWLNFSGGTLTPGATASALFSDTMTRVTVNGPFGDFAGGAVIDTAGKNTVIAAPLQAPTGNGVSAIGLSFQGGGYIGEPLVTIAGGGGEGATGVANMTGDGNGTYKVGSITIINPGWNYTSAPAVTFKGGGTTNHAVASGFVLAANASGGLTKQGAGVLTLSATNSFTGMTTISGGTLKLGRADALPPNAPVTLAGGTYDLGGFTVTNRLTVISGAITNGTLRTDLSPAGTGVVGTQSLALQAGASIQGTYYTDVTTNGLSDAVAVTGNIDLSGLALQIVDTAQLNRQQTYTLLTCSGVRTGELGWPSRPDSRWHIVYQANGDVQLRFVDGMLIKIK